MTPVWEPILEIEAWLRLLELAEDSDILERETLLGINQVRDVLRHLDDRLDALEDRVIAVPEEHKLDDALYRWGEEIRVGTERTKAARALLSEDES